MQSGFVTEAEFDRVVDPRKRVAPLRSWGRLIPDLALRIVILGIRPSSDSLEQLASIGVGAPLA